LSGIAVDPAYERLVEQLAAAQARSDALSASAAYEVGSLVLRSRRPRQAVRLPAELVRLRRRRQDRAAQRASRSGTTPPPTADPEALFQSFDAPVPLPPDRLRLAVVAPPSVVRRLGCAAHTRLVHPMAAARGLALGDDALVVTLSAGRRGPWFGLGSGDAPERDVALRAVLARARELAVPVLVLADRDPSELLSAADLTERADVVIGAPDAPWDPGVDWRDESPLGPLHPGGDVWIGSPASSVPAGAVVLGDPHGPLDPDDAGAVGAVLRGAARLLLAPDAPPRLRRLALLTGRAVDAFEAGTTVPAPGAAEGAAGRALVRATVGHDDAPARVAQVAAALGARPSAARPTVTVVAADGERAGVLAADPQVVDVVSPHRIRAARGDVLVRAGAWAEDADLRGDVLAAASYADAVELSPGPVAGAVGRAWSTSSAVLIRRELASATADPWSVDGVRVAVLPEASTA
jgi:hypothetical protein